MSVSPAKAPRGRGSHTRGSGRSPACRNREQVADRPLGRPSSKWLPNYVETCQKRRLSGSGGWTLRLQHRVTAEEVHIPYECGSWRCDGKCRTRYRQMEYVRISNALAKHAPTSVYFAVLTLRQRDVGVGANYAALGSVWPKLRKRMRRFLGPFDYVATVEEHRSGHPHMNLVIVSDSLELAVLHDSGRLLRWFKGEATAAGWGYMATIERARSVERVAAYISKVAVGEVAAAEVSKTSQLPWHAPPGTRRLRSSRGFLEPRRTTGEWTGELLFEPLESIEGREKRRQWPLGRFHAYFRALCSCQKCCRGGLELRDRRLGFAVPQVRRARDALELAL